MGSTFLSEFMMIQISIQFIYSITNRTIFVIKQNKESLNFTKLMLVSNGNGYNFRIYNSVHS